MIDLLDEYKELIVFVFICILFSIIISTPVIYWSGKVRSEYLLQEKQMLIPWYKSAFLPNTIFIDVKIK